MIRCPECDTEVQPTWDWCHVCGWDPDGRRDAGAMRAAPVAAPRPPVGGRGSIGSTVVPVAIGAVVGFVVVAVVAVVAVTLLGTPQATSTFAPVEGAIESADGPAAPLTPAPSDAVPPGAAWPRYTAADGSFGIDFPGEPEILSTPARPGSRYSMAEQASLQVGSVRYTALFQEHAPGYEIPDPIALLHEEVDPKLELQGITEITKTPTTFAGVPALEFSGSSADGASVADGVAFIAGNRLYVLVVDSDPLGQRQVQRFLDSFALA
jgi:hypothetical protein